MNMGVAATTEGYQVPFAVAASATAELEMMNFEPSSCATDLAGPTVTLQDCVV